MKNNLFIRIIRDKNNYLKFNAKINEELAGEIIAFIGKKGKYLPIPPSK
jgi:hypothetical protein